MLTNGTTVTMPVVMYRMHRLGDLSPSTDHDLFTHTV